MTNSPTCAADLQAYRCPDATIKANAYLQIFAQSDMAQLTITSIEPSLLKSLQHRLVNEHPSIKLVGTSTRAITDQDIQSWQPMFDDDDYGDVSTIVVFTISKIER